MSTAEPLKPYHTSHPFRDISLQKYRVRVTVNEVLLHSRFETDEFVWVLSVNRQVQTRVHIALSLESPAQFVDEVHASAKCFNECSGQVYATSVLSDVLHPAEEPRHWILSVDIGPAHLIFEFRLMRRLRTSSSANGDKIMADYGALLKQGLLSDVTLVVYAVQKPSVGKRMQELKGHRAVLSARSPVFAELMKKTFRNQRLVLYLDASQSHEDFERLLRFIYTGDCSCEHLAERNVDGLLSLALRYQLDDLIKAHEDEMERIMNPDNVVGLLIKADAIKRAWQKSLAIRYINRELKTVVGTDRYKKMVKSHPYLLDEILRAQIEEKSEDADDAEDVQVEKTMI